MSGDDLDANQVLDDSFDLLENNKRLSPPAPKEFSKKRMFVESTPNSFSKRFNLKSVLRKFPGPAGILPDKRMNLSIKDLEEPKNKKSEEMICSQYTMNIFKEGPWMNMLKEFYDGNVNISLPEKYTISWLKTQATSKQLIGQKTPFLAAIIHSIDCTNKDPIVVLKDTTGEIYGTIHHEVWVEYGELLVVSSVIVLRQVGVLRTTKRHYLNITLNNLVTIYNNVKQLENVSTENLSDLKITRIQKLTSRDFVKSIEETIKKQKLFQTENLKPALNNPFLNTSLNSNVINVSKPYSSCLKSNISTTSLQPRNTSYSTSKFNLDVGNKSNILKYNASKHVSKNLNLSNGSFHWEPNSQSSSISSAGVLNQKDISFNMNLSLDEQSEIDNVFDGVDTNSLFEDF